MTVGVGQPQSGIKSRQKLHVRYCSTLLIFIVCTVGIDFRYMFIVQLAGEREEEDG